MKDNGFLFPVCAGTYTFSKSLINLILSFRFLQIGKQCSCKRCDKHEATAFSDPENEYLIQKAFEKLIQNKTVVMIAHRLSTIRNADQILVMEKSKLIEVGTHDELLKQNGRYAQMWSSYTESINWKIGTGKAV